MKNFSEGTPFGLVLKMDWISTCGWGEDLELILANQAKEHSKRGTNTSGSTLAKVKDAWWQMIQLLPQSYNQKATVQLNYAVLRNIYHSRRTHKLDEWHIFCKWIEDLPYSELIIGENNDNG